MQPTQYVFILLNRINDPNLRDYVTVDFLEICNRLLYSNTAPPPPPPPPPSWSIYVICTKLVTNVLNLRASKGLGEYISQLIARVDKTNSDFSREHLFSNKVTINFNVFGSFMEDY